MNITRPLLAILGSVWLVAGVIGVVLGLVGAEWLLAQLPPLAIGAAAVGGAATAIGSAFVGFAALHGAVVIGLGRHLRWPVTAGILLSASAFVAMLAIAASAATSMVRSPDQALPLLGGVVGALVAAAAYAWCAAALLRRSGRVGRIGPSGGAN